MPNRDDHALIDACLAGQTDAFGLLVERYQDRLLHTLVCILGSREDAKDVAQDAFVQAFRKLETFRREASFYSWLFRIAINAAVTFQRRSRRSRVALSTDREHGVEPCDEHPEARPSHGIESAERQAQVRAALNQLTPEYRTALVLKEIEGLKYEEIAEQVGCPLGTVRSRIHRARAELREKLTRVMGDESFD